MNQEYRCLNLFILIILNSDIPGTTDKHNLTLPSKEMKDWECSTKFVLARSYPCFILGIILPRYIASFHIWHLKCEIFASLACPVIWDLYLSNLEFWGGNSLKFQPPPDNFYRFAIYMTLDLKLKLFLRNNYLNWKNEENSYE